MRKAGEYRATWDTIERLWSETVARAGQLPEHALHQRVDGEWSFVETLRHLVMATDRWAGYMVLDKPAPYHPLGFPQPGFTPADAAALGIDLDARPSLAAVLEARGTRVALVRGIVDGLTDDDLERVCPRLPAPGYPEHSTESRAHPSGARHSRARLICGLRAVDRPIEEVQQVIGMDDALCSPSETRPRA